MKITKQSKRDAKHLYRLCRVNGVIDENRVRNVVRRVIATGRREAPAILAHFLGLVKLDIASHTATVQSATLLPADVQAGIKAGVDGRYGPGVTTVFARDPALIGGVRIKVGWDVYDGSVRGGLSALAEVFKRGNYV